MCCPFAKRCPTFETFACEEKQHLVWAFCLGEHRDCDHYKCMLSGEGSAGEDGSGAERDLVSEKDRILSRLRANLLDPRARS